MEIKSIKKKIQNIDILYYHYPRMKHLGSSRTNYLFKKKCISIGPLTKSFKANGQRAGTFSGGPKY